jgi:hypothetical protein
VVALSIHAVQCVDLFAQRVEQGGRERDEHTRRSQTRDHRPGRTTVALFDGAAQNAKSL